MQNIAINNNKNITFKGLNENIKIARNEIHNFHKVFGQPHSDSFICLKIYEHIDDAKYLPIVENLKILAERYARKMKNDYWNQYLSGRFRYLENPTKRMHTKFIEQLKQNILKSRVANCDQQADILQYQLSQKGINSRIVNFVIRNKDTNKRRFCGAHAFVVIGMNKKATKTPSTWGKNAVIADTWSNLAESAETGLKYFLEIFKFNPEKEYIEFLK